MNKDVFIFDTADGGDITQDLAIRDGLESSVYLSLFGGNVKDDGRENNAFKWWGNIGENNPPRQYRSETAYLLATVPPTPSNLRRVEDAAGRDLAWCITEAVSKTVKVVASMPKLNFVKLVVALEGISPLEFRAHWGDSFGDDVPQTLVPVPTVILNNGQELSGTGLANAFLVLFRGDGEETQVPIGKDGSWKFEPYPLEVGEVATIYVKTLSGLSSRGRTVL